VIGKYKIIYDDKGMNPVEKTGEILEEYGDLLLVRLDYNNKEEWINRRFIIRAEKKGGKVKGI